MKIKRVRRGRPVLDMTVRRTRTSANLKRVSLRLPAGLRFRSRPTAAALRGISVRTSGGRQVARRNIRVERGRMVITHTAGSPVLRVTLRRGIVETGRTFRRLAMRRLKARRLTFRVGITDVQNEALHDHQAHPAAVVAGGDSRVGRSAARSLRGRAVVVPGA